MFVSAEVVPASEVGRMIELLLDAGAVVRLTRLVSVDTFPPILALREAIVERHTTHHDNGIDEPDAWAELVRCPHCCSAWLALGVCAARLLFPRQWGFAAKVLTLSAIAGNVSAWLDDDE